MGKIFLLLVFSLIAVASKAQTPDSLFKKLGDFDLARFNNDTYGAVALGEEILPDTAKIAKKTRITFFDHLAKAYEDNEQEKLALIYFEKVAVAVPDYYVAQRALGYLYNEDAEEIQSKLHQTPKNDAAYPALFDSYRKAVLKALPHLEKAQACDPDDDTLDLIRTLYRNIHDEQSLNSLNVRLSSLSKNCIDLLSDQ